MPRRIILFALFLVAGGAPAFSGNVYEAKYVNQADAKIFFVKYPNQADLKVYLVKYQNQAGWRKSSRSREMFK